MPVTGPYITEEYDFFTYKYEKTLKQSKPYYLPLSYTLMYAETFGPQHGAKTFIWPYTSPDVKIQIAENKAAGKLLDSLSSRVNLAVALAEGRQTVNMIASRALQLVNAARQIRKRDFRGAAKTLGIKQPRGASRSKQFADNWLEYSFGWSPVIQDLFSLGDILQKPISMNLRATGRGSVTTVTKEGKYPVPDVGKQAWQRTVTGRVHCGVDIVWIKPDLWMMNQLGLVNPLSVVWEKIPYSFVLDWVTDFGAYLESLTGLVGVETARPYTTFSCRSSYRHISRFLHPETGQVVTSIAAGRSFHMERKLQLPVTRPVLEFSRLSVTRGLNAISLLIQQLRRP